MLYLFELIKVLLDHGTLFETKNGSGTVVQEQQMMSEKSYVICLISINQTSYLVSGAPKTLLCHVRDTGRNDRSTVANLIAMLAAFSSRSHNNFCNKKKGS